MIESTVGDLLKANVDALVNTVNCVGVMGKGIALQFKMAFPENFKQYHAACKKNEVQIGKMFITKQLMVPRFIVNFPTKTHWKQKSELEYIRKGLEDLKDKIKDLDIKSIAIPPLGAGLGGLNWLDVKALIYQYLGDLEDVHILLFEPAGSPHPDTIRIGTPKPKMTNGRAIMLNLLEQYKEPGYRLTLLEIHKLMYFVREVGEPLRLEYAKRQFGPYAPKLEHLIQKLEGHFLRGYGDRTRESSIRLIKEALDEAKQFLSGKDDVLQRLQKVVRLIRGFETPYGLELLATVHWTVKYDHKTKEDDVIDSVRAWNTRKADLFSPAHIRLALAHLQKMEMFNHSASPTSPASGC